MTVTFHGSIMVVETEKMDVAYHQQTPLAVVFKNEDYSRVSFISTSSPTASMSPIKRAVEVLGCGSAEKVSRGEIMDMVKAEKAPEKEYYRMGFDDAVRLETKGHVAELNPNNCSVEQYKDYTFGWNAGLESIGNKNEKY